MPNALVPLTLEQTALFQDLTPKQIKLAESLLHRKTFPAGAIIIAEDQPGEVAYIILQGSVKVCVEGADGSSVIIAIRGAGEVVGEMSLLDGLGRSATVITQEESVVLWLDRVAFWEKLWDMPPVAYNLTHMLSRRLRLLTVRVQVFSSQDVRGRVAHQLLAFAREYGQPVEGGAHGHHGQDATVIPFRLTQIDLASMVGASRVRVNQIFGIWKRRRLISISLDQRVTIHDKAALQRDCT